MEPTRKRRAHGQKITAQFPEFKWVIISTGHSISQASSDSLGAGRYTCPGVGKIQSSIPAPTVISWLCDLEQVLGFLILNFLISTMEIIPRSTRDKPVCELNLMTGIGKLPITGLILTNPQHQENHRNSRGPQVEPGKKTPATLLSSG